MSPRRWLRVVPLLALVAAGACSDAGGSPPDPELLGLGRIWVVTSVTEDGDERRIPDANDFLDPAHITVVFERDRLHAAVGHCNGLSASYTFDGDRLAIEELDRSILSCGTEAPTTEEEWLASLLHVRPSVTVSDDELTMETDDTTVRLVVGGVADT